MGYSNGGSTTLMSMTKKEADHPHHFAAGFPIAPDCYSVIAKFRDYYGPMIVFMGDQDDANPPNVVSRTGEEEAGRRRSS